MRAKWRSTSQQTGGTLLRQAKYTATDYMREAVEQIDRLFGDGQAKKYPELVSAYMRACCADMGAASIAKAIEEVACAIEVLASKLEKDI